MGKGGCSATARTDHTCAKHILWDEIKNHSCADSCWIVVLGKVYDVTNFVPRHPGGKAILAYAGRDASDVFSAFHAPSTYSVLRQYYVGDAEVSVQDRMLTAFRGMRTKMIRAGLFKSSKSFYAWKILSLTAMYSTMTSVLVNSRGSWSSCFLASFLLALCWQQSGWLAHDFLHHQVFRNRCLNTVAGFFIGNFLQGFSVNWWKSKHNTHHAVPNECTSGGEAMDPDIDTLPMVAWHEDMAKHVSDGVRSLLRLQHYLFFPLLCFARMAWAQQSLQHAYVLSCVSKQGLLELLLLLLHYGVMLGGAFWSFGIVRGIFFFLLAQIFAGFLLALVFVQSHNAMEVYMEPKDFVSAQIVSTRNITSTLWMDWFTGGLNYQIEHHLFPTLPRHNLQKAKALVMRFCCEHKFKYESCGMDTGTYRVLQRLSAIAASL